MAIKLEVSSDIIHDSFQMEATQMPTGIEVDLYTVLHSE